MANTEGLTDEVVSSMLAMPSPDEERQLNFRRQSALPQRLLTRREQMMDSLGEGEIPAAKVVRASAPKVHSSSSLKKSRSKKYGNVRSGMPKSPSEAKTQLNSNERTDRPVANKIQHRPIVSASIQERPLHLGARSATTTTSQQKKKESRFKQRQLRKGKGKANPTLGGFPSLDFARVGSLTRKGRATQVDGSSSTLSGQMRVQNNQTKLNSSSERTTEMGRANESMLANMSIEEIRDGIEEVKSIFSDESIAFLRKRGKRKKQNDHLSPREGVTMKQTSSEQIIKEVENPSLTKEIELELEEKKIRDGKEKVAEMLSNIRTPEDMENSYNEAIELGLAPSLPTSVLQIDEKLPLDERNSKLHTATSLLRSTALRQKMLAARCICNILEEDVDKLFNGMRRNCFSISTDERLSRLKAYPILLPVALRCLLDESIGLANKPSGRLLLSHCLLSIHFLMKLFVHPYHIVHINPSSVGVHDPFELYATHFMSDISHVPSGAELYPPTKITPIEKNGTNGSCYRADSSAASAESDSKVFYNDPSWILLSRMRILPCLSDVITVLSNEVSSGGHIDVLTIESICAILAMLATRLPGAALAIANHKGLLPFLASYCLRPGADESGALFGTQKALPFLILLATLARQSKDVAKLEVPYEVIIPHLQGILCLQTNNANHLQVKMWSLILVRILFRYGLATEHAQTFIRIAVPFVVVQKPENWLCVHFLSLFAVMCDAFILTERKGQDQLSSIPEQDDSLSMTPLWLSPSVKNCTKELLLLLHNCNSDENNTLPILKMAASQLQLLSSFLHAEQLSVASESVAVLSRETCCNIINKVIDSALLKHSLEISLGWSFRASWLETGSKFKPISLEEEASACAFVIAFMNVVAHFATTGDLTSCLMRVLLSTMREVKSQHEMHLYTCDNILHIARQSMFVEAECAVLKFLSETGSGKCVEIQESDRSFLLVFAIALIGRMNVGHEAIAYSVFSQKVFFRRDGNQELVDFVRSLFLGELSSVTEDRRTQLMHSETLFNSGLVHSLRCTADFSSATTKSGERFFLPLGSTWLWNVLSSTITPEEAHGEGLGIKTATGIVAGALSILAELEESCPGYVNKGTKLYHLCNVCLFPEEMLREDVIESYLSMLLKQLLYGTNDPAMVRDFIQECFHHSRLSRVKTNDEDKPTSPDTSLSLEGVLLDDEMKALDDFVGDLCDSFIEYGGQYEFCARFMRFFLRFEFPTQIIKSIADKLQPILNLLSIENENRDSLKSSIFQSMKGGLPSIDSSPRDSSDLLDAFAASLKKPNKLARADYFYMLAVSFLSRNLASSFQRCECGLEAMKKRLIGVNASVLYDVVLSSKQLLNDTAGTKERMVDCIIDICLDNSTNLELQDSETQQLWQLGETTDSETWKVVVDYLK